MAAVVEQRPEKLEIGDVFGTTFGVIGRNLVLCLLLGSLLAGLPVALQLYSEFNSFPPDQALTPDAVPTVMDYAWGVAVQLISLAIWSILQAAFVRLVIEDFSGRQPRFGDCLATGFAVVLPVTGMLILIGLGVTLGMLLLIVPGIMLALRWFVSVPVLVTEKRGLWKACLAVLF